ncbi:MAG TPA: FAD-dependent oxidoreductase, partial [Oleiagrimonas sp.]|nr:FAD-dependent oxidoreductase [Oleiagrimonas sp.]
MEDAQAAGLIAASRGTHLALDACWAPAGAGLLVPRTSDDRVLFLLPWQGGTLAGTTDVAAAATDAPEPSDAEVDYLLGQLGEWLQPAPVRADIRAQWAGLRPLIAEQSTRTARIVREHHVEVGPAGLVSIAGGKWTTYRLMAEETVDRAIETAGLNAAGPCRTRALPLLGAENYHPGLVRELAARHGLDDDVARHLARAYGGQAEQVLQQAGANGHERLLAGYPYLLAEVTWARDQEMALTAEDVLARRLRLSFVDAAAATTARERVQSLLEKPV